MMATRGRPRKYPEGEAPSRAEHCKRRRARLKAAGKCARCGKNEAAEGFLHCQDCLDSQKAYSRAKYAAKPKVRKARKPKMNANYRQSVRHRARYARRKSLGLCVKCERPTDHGRAYCAECSSDVRAYQKRHASSGGERWIR